MAVDSIERGTAVGAETASLSGTNPESIQVKPFTEHPHRLTTAIKGPFRVIDNDVQPFRYSDRFRKIDYLIAGSAGLIAVLSYLNYI